MANALLPDEPLLKSRALVKDGVWQVPPNERPPNWQTMAVRERVETETRTRTRTKRTTEIVVQEQPEAPEPTPAEVVQVTAAIEAASTETEPPIVSHLPRDGAYVERIIDRLHGIASSDPQNEDEEIIRENEFNLLWEEQDEIVRYRKSKTKVDLALSHWLHRHRATLRHVGLGSEAIKDLWRVFQAGIILEMEDADRRIAKEREK